MIVKVQLVTHSIIPNLNSGLVPIDPVGLVDPELETISTILYSHLAEQQPHDLEVAAAPGVHHHLEQGQGRDLDVFEEVRILVPGLGRQEALLLLPVILVDLVSCTDLHHVVAELPGLLGNLGLRLGHTDHFYSL